VGHDVTFGLTMGSLKSSGFTIHKKKREESRINCKRVSEYGRVVRIHIIGVQFLRINSVVRS